MGKHTEGPWELCEKGDYGDFEGNSRVICGDDMRLAVVHAGGPNDEENKANAELMHAAPELLATLRLMCKTAQDIPTQSPSLHTSFDRANASALKLLDRLSEI